MNRWSIRKETREEHLRTLEEIWPQFEGNIGVNEEMSINPHNIIINLNCNEKKLNLTLVISSQNSADSSSSETLHFPLLLNPQLSFSMKDTAFERMCERSGKGRK